MQDVSALHARDAFAALLGIELVSDDPITLRVPLTERHTNFHGGTHGGVVFALADAAFALASNAPGPQALAIDAHLTLNGGSAARISSRARGSTSTTAELGLSRVSRANGACSPCVRNPSPRPVSPELLRLVHATKPARAGRLRVEGVAGSSYSSQATRASSAPGAPVRHWSDSAPPFSLSTPLPPKSRSRPAPPRRVSAPRPPRSTSLPSSP